MIDAQIEALKAKRALGQAPPPNYTVLQNGGHLIIVPSVDIGPGWTRRIADVLFVAPPGYPAANPDCFWVEPDGLRLEGGGTPQNSNDANLIPADPVTGRKTTWFSW